MNYLLALLLFFGLTGQQKNEKVYAILYKGDKAGEMKAKKWQEGAFTVFENTSRASIRMLATLEIRYHQKAIFDEQGQLYSAEYTLWVNDGVHRRSSIKKEGGRYLATINGKSQQIELPIEYSASCLMLAEPNDHRSVFSEQYGQHHKLIPQAPGQFKKIASDGKVNHYHYNKEGILQYAKLDGGLLSFELKLLP